MLFAALDGSSARCRGTRGSAKSDDECLMTMNDEVRFLGQWGDDEDDLGLEELFSSTAAVPPIAGGPVMPDEDNGAGGVITSLTTRTKRSRMTKSDVWNDFEEIKRVEQGEEVKYAK